MFFRTMKVKQFPTRNKYMKSFIKSITDAEFDDSAIEKLCCAEKKFVRDLSEEKKYVENETGKKQINSRKESIMIGQPF